MLMFIDRAYFSNIVDFLYIYMVKVNKHVEPDRAQSLLVVQTSMSAKSGALIMDQHGDP